MSEDALKAYMAKRTEAKEGKKSGGSSESGDRKTFKFLQLNQDTKPANVRFLPQEGTPLPGFEVVEHRRLPFSYGDKYKKNKVTCMKPYFGSCPICDVVDANFKNFKEICKEIQASTNVWFQVAVTDDQNLTWSKDGKDVPTKETEAYLMVRKPWDLDFLVECILNPEKGDPIDLMEGHKVEYKRKTNGGAFERTMLIKPTPLAYTFEDGKFIPDEEKMQKILDDRIDLSKIYRKPDDAYRNNIVKDVAEKLTAYFADKKALLEDNLDENALGIPNVEVEAKVPTPDNTKEVVVTAEESRPAGSPACFGNKDKFYGGYSSFSEAKMDKDNWTAESKEQINECVGCLFDTDCKAKVKS